jgi:hypothetical protein
MVRLRGACGVISAALREGPQISQMNADLAGEPSGWFCLWAVTAGRQFFICVYLWFLFGGEGGRGSELQLFEQPVDLLVGLVAQALALDSGVVEDVVHIAADVIDQRADDGALDVAGGLGDRAGNGDGEAKVGGQHKFGMLGGMFTRQTGVLHHGLDMAALDEVAFFRSQIEAKYDIRARNADFVLNAAHGGHVDTGYFTG